MKNLKRLFNTRMHWAGGCVSQHALGREGDVCASQYTLGVCIPACTGQGRCLSWGVDGQMEGVSAQGVSARGGVCPGGCLPGGCLPGRVWQTPPCGHNSRHALVKTLPCRNFVAGGKNSFQIGNSRLSQPFVSLARNLVFPEHYCKNRKYVTVL